MTSSIGQSFIETGISFNPARIKLMRPAAERGQMDESSSQHLQLLLTDPRFADLPPDVRAEIGELRQLQEHAQGQGHGE